MGGNDKFRGPEDKVIEREHKKELAQTGDAQNMPLCESHALPKGITCYSRTEIKGLYFCAGSKEGCPLEAT